MRKYFAWFITTCKRVLSAVRRVLTHRQPAETIRAQCDVGSCWQNRASLLIKSFREFQAELIAWYKSQCMMHELRLRDSTASNCSGFEQVALMLEAFIMRMTSWQQSDSWKLSPDTDHELYNMLASLRNRIKDPRQPELSDPMIRSDLYARLKDGINRCHAIFDEGLVG